jgi:hypothetical protein
VVVDHIIAGGCSFSAHGLGGIPPNPNQPTGGCSYINQGNGTAMEPNTWVGYLAQQFQVQSLANTATGGHGIILLANSILQVLSKFDYNLDRTLVVFNISDPARLDIPCGFDHANRSHQVTWNNNILTHTYLDRESSLFHNIAKNIGIDQIEVMTATALEFLFNFLENNNVKYCFMTMRDYRNSSIGPILAKQQHHQVTFDNEPGMYEFCQQRNLIGPDRSHPSRLGHELMSQYVYQWINQNL